MSVTELERLELCLEKLEEKVDAHFDETRAKLEALLISVARLTASSCPAPGSCSSLSSMTGQLAEKLAAMQKKVNELELWKARSSGTIAGIAVVWSTASAIIVGVVTWMITTHAGTK